MGGYGSGRRRQHHTTCDCLQIDTALLRKRKLLIGDMKKGASVQYVAQAKSVKEKVTETAHNLCILVERYAPGAAGKFSFLGAAGHVTLTYDVRIGDENKNIQAIDIPLVITPCNYGGSRYWLLAPCCGRRCRVVYLPIYGRADQIVPLCRNCLELHYASQQQSYIERHKTYEKHLLRNYGYTWATWEYHDLKEHYQEITPELAYIQQRSILDRELEMLRLMIRVERFLMRADIHTLRSLKSEADRRAYLDFLLADRGAGYVLELARMMGMSEQVNQDETRSFEQAYLAAVNQDSQESQETTLQEPLCLHSLIERKRDTEYELELLRAA